jgi:PTS system ascorbate-specific IIA component
MTVGLLIITHDRIGETLLRTANRMLSDMPLAIKALSVTIDSNTEELSREALSLLDQIDQGDGALVLTDMYGSTPSNIAFGLMQPGRVHVISGINLPMLIRTLNYATLDLGALTEKAISGGKEGIFCCTRTEQT